VPEPSGKLRIFISWSLPLSHKVALILRDWLPRVIQGVDPWVSSEDIEKGTWWNQNLIEAIEVSTVGIVVITPANLERAWINFEAGALARAIRPSGGIVAPVLVDVPGSSIDGPLGSLQVTRLDSEDDFFQLVKAINNRIADPLSEGHLQDEFKLKWHMLKEKVAAAVRKNDPDGKQKPKRDQEDIIEDLVSAFRDLRQDMKSFTGPSLLERQIYISEAPLLDPITQIFENEGVTNAYRLDSVGPDGTVRINVDDLDFLDEAVQRAYKEVSKIRKYVLLPTPPHLRVAQDGKIEIPVQRRMQGLGGA
jgi:hypothetical protein